MQDILTIAGFVSVAFFIGYALRKPAAKRGHKELSIKAAADLQAEQLEATVSASLDGIIIIDSNGYILEFSESAERIFGHKKTDIFGKNMVDLIVPERYRAAHNAGMARMRETGKANILGQRIEIEALRANGEEFMSELAISQSRGSNGNIFIAYIRDISEAKAAEKALRDAKEAAELANRAKTQFVSSMSHEIRTPFNAVLGILEILGDTKLTHDQKQLVKTADRSSRALLRIINDVLDYARISSGSVKIKKASFHAPDIFDDVYHLFAMQAKDKNIELAVDNSKAESLHLSGDAGRIRQILMNFVSNAIKYTKDGKIDLIIETKHSDDGGIHLICKVKDNGLGIGDDKQEHLFKEFYMAEEIDVRASEGTGLGLTICKVLTKMMGGSIGVQSQLGNGSEFWINIPLHETQASMVSEDVPAARADISGLKILLVED
ncbi:MAG: ATP-binding protein, partial [Litorimonas sp.]